MSTANILIGFKNNWYNDVSYIKLHGNITSIATIKSSFDELKEEVLKDTHRDKTPSYKTPALRKTATGVWAVGTSNWLFIRGS